MARFRGTVQGQRGEVSRLGNRSSGLMTSCRGWNLGVDVRVGTGYLEKDCDSFNIYINKGSNNPIPILTLRLTDDGEYVRLSVVAEKHGNLKDWSLEVAK